MTSFAMHDDFDLNKYQEKMKELCEDKLSFGNSFLDDACGGILKNDLIIIAAPSGMGKTQQAASIAIQNAKEGKNVYMFSLEAFKYEIEARNIYSSAMSCYYKQKIKYIKFTFQDYLENKIPEELNIYIKGAAEEMKVLSKNLKVFYPEKDYSIKDFEKHLVEISINADLVIIDHLHYFDINSNNENSEITGIVKKLRDLVLISDIPIILVSHIRKNNNIKTKIVPSQEDLHGTSNIAKISTKVITLAPNFKRNLKEAYLYSTWIRVSKNRYNGGVQRYCASLDFDVRTNTYSKKYFLYKLNFEENDVKEINSSFPDWVKTQKLS